MDDTDVAAATDALTTIATRVICDAGPDVGGCALVGPGSVVVGRSPSADLTIRDPAIELHHLLLEPASGGCVRVVQLSGRALARVGDRPLVTPLVVPPGGVVTFGASRLRLASPAAHGVPPSPAEEATASVALLLTSSAPTPRTAEATMFRVHVGVTEAGGAVITDLGPGAVVQLTGPGASGVARSFVIQLAAQVPVHRLTIVIGGATGWLPDGVRLPHLGVAAPAGATEHVVVFAADPVAASLEPSALRARLGVCATAAVVLLDDRATDANTALPGGRLSLGALGRGRWAPDATVAGSLLVHAAGVTTATVERFTPPAPSGPRWVLPSTPTPVLTSAIRTIPSTPSTSSSPGALDPAGWTATVEQLAAGQRVDARGVVDGWRRVTGRPTLWLGRDGATATWLQLGGGPVLVVGTDDRRRTEVLATFAAALALDHHPASLGLVMGAGVPSPGPTHAIGGPLAPARIGHELARPQPSAGRSRVIVADDADGQAATASLDRGIVVLARAALADDRHLIVGLRPDHPWAAPLLTDEATTVVVTGGADLPPELTPATMGLRPSPSALAAGEVIVRTPALAARVVAVVRLDEAARRALASTLRQAAALVDDPPADEEHRATAVRSCGPCPDDDSPWVRPSSDRSSAPMLAPASSPV